MHSCLLVGIADKTQPREEVRGSKALRAERLPLLNNLSDYWRIVQETPTLVAAPVFDIGPICSLVQPYPKLRAADEEVGPQERRTHRRGHVLSQHCQLRHVLKHYSPHLSQVWFLGTIMKLLPLRVSPDEPRVQLGIIVTPPPDTRVRSAPKGSDPNFHRRQSVAKGLVLGLSNAPWKQRPQSRALPIVGLPLQNSMDLPCDVVRCSIVIARIHTVGSENSFGTAQMRRLDNEIGRL
mmetsp:Transcript_27661/g.72949  ORF Transcript_27661/g.72949 Transcript_27661/m.72949 type:complete len:237 (-) Transcript_27661:700-1410(-)